MRDSTPLTIRLLGGRKTAAAPRAKRVKEKEVDELKPAPAGLPATKKDVRAFAQIE